MYVRNGARFTGVLAKDRWAIAALLVLALITEWLDLPLDEYELVSVVYVGIFSTALSIGRSIMALLKFDTQIKSPAESAM